MKIVQAASDITELNKQWRTKLQGLESQIKGIREQIKITKDPSSKGRLRDRLHLLLKQKTQMEIQRDTQRNAIRKQKLAERP